MFDVVLNKVEINALCQLMESNTLEAREEVIDLIDNLLEMRFNRGRRLGKAAFTDAVIESIVCELKR